MTTGLVRHRPVPVPALRIACGTLETVRPNGRLEYRVWPGAAHPATARLHARWPQTGAERRDDIYLLHADSDRALIKLRAGTRIEIKRRHRDAGRVQHWSMPLSTGFPLGPGTREALARALSLAALPPVAGESPAHLLAALAGMRAPVLPKTVRKARLLFGDETCRAEICRVAVDGWRGTTVALEATDPQAMTRATTSLRLNGLPNRSYGAALMALTGPQGRDGVPG